MEAMRSCPLPSSHSRVVYAAAAPLRYMLGLCETPHEIHHGRSISWSTQFSSAHFFLVAHILWIILHPSLFCVVRIDQLIWETSGVFTLGVCGPPHSHFPIFHGLGCERKERTHYAHTYMLLIFPMVSS